MTTVRAIETVYPWPNGPRYRSRLEARWAVFFDGLGVKYEYEKEGYDLGEAGLYLPDFWLPDLFYWLEVKPTAPTDHEKKLMRALIEATDEPGIIAWGLPCAGGMMGYLWHKGPGFPSTDRPVLKDYEVAFGLCDVCGAVGIFVYADCEPHMRRARDGWAGPPFCDGYFDLRFFGSEHPAPTAARQARFEHGEHGR